jgi:hypothetical protein
MPFRQMVQHPGGQDGVADAAGGDEQDAHAIMLLPRFGLSDKRPAAVPRAPNSG